VISLLEYHPVLRLDFARDLHVVAFSVELRGISDEVQSTYKDLDTTAGSAAVVESPASISCRFAWIWRSFALILAWGKEPSAAKSRSRLSLAYA